MNLNESNQINPNDTKIYNLELRIDKLEYQISILLNIIIALAICGLLIVVVIYNMV